ncbi:hypothetical protein DAD186_20420 [Dermabacter vaginalis]|uniref:Uncharacterized protein n=1 Tax=Dermabacter vaginalis TaxID=1630135 RepID=A0A1B0ZL38_9MICO|nr:hypothetical protein DAD186_20420 [Dermabacter vaginalis]
MSLTSRLGVHISSRAFAPVPGIGTLTKVMNFCVAWEAPQ